MNFVTRLAKFGQKVYQITEDIFFTKINGSSYRDLYFYHRCCMQEKIIRQALRRRKLGAVTVLRVHNLPGMNYSCLAACLSSECESYFSVAPCTVLFLFIQLVHVGQNRHTV